MFNFLKKEYWALFFIAVFVFFSFPFLLKGLLPIPSDSLVGLYHPFRDFYAGDYSRGVPFKNFLITDPIRQIYPWKELALEGIVKFTIPIWNPYEMAGKPLLANFQSSPLYPLNIILLLKPFHLYWSVFILMQIPLAGLFMYLYLRGLFVHRLAGLLGALAWVFSGFFVAWFEWGNILHTALWLPLILLSSDKILLGQKTKSNLTWGTIFLFSLVSSFFAGHLQIFFYVFVFSLLYIFTKILYLRNSKSLPVFIFMLSIFCLITAVQWFPGLQFINLSGRNVDSLLQWTKDGWFVPWQNLVQFIVPDFFGNPATLNYWGVWNYGEFIGYVGILPLLFAFLAILARRDKKTLFFGFSLVSLLSLALPTPLAKLPYQLAIPFLSTSQPTRLISLICFCLVVLGALGFDYFLKNYKSQKKIITKNAVIIFGIVSLFFTGSILFVLFGQNSNEYLLITKRNLIFPGIIFIFYVILFALFSIISNKRIRYAFLFLALIVFAIDVVRFSLKFNPFTQHAYLYPVTKTVSFLQRDTSVFRIASTDLRIFPPNTLTHYKIQTIEGYDPLYILTYAEFITALERGKPDVALPFGFNRIITPHNIESNLMDFLNVKYVLSLTDIKSDKLIKVFQEGETRIYENKNVFPRVFFVNNIIIKNNKKEVLEAIFSSDLRSTAVVEGGFQASDTLTAGDAEIVLYSENKVVVKTKNEGKGFLVFSDTYYPSWKVTIDDKISKIYKTNHSFRGVFVDSGAHTIVFYTSLF
jgi:hypothetical protein